MQFVLYITFFKLRITAGKLPNKCSLYVLYIPFFKLRITAGKLTNKCSLYCNNVFKVKDHYR
jgi:hypothetical protein